MHNRNVIILAAFIFIAISAILLALISLKIALLFFFGSIFALAVLINPFTGFLVLILFLFIRPQEFLPGLEKLHIVLVLAVMIILSHMFSYIIRREKIKAFASRQHYLMLALLLIVPISHLSNLDLNAAWEGFNSFLTTFLLFIIIVDIVNDERKLRWTIITIVASTVALAINGIIQYHRGYDLLGNPLVMDRIRWVGAFENPNDLALIFNSLLPFVLVNLFEKLEKWKKTILLLVLASFVLAIFYTNSRGGYIALLAILLVFSFKRWGLAKGIAFGLLCLVVGFAISPSRMADLSPYGVSASGRISAWTDGLVYLKANPFFGVGYMHFAATQRMAAHSAFVQCYSELGLVGYFVWLALIYTTLKDLFNSERLASTQLQKKYILILQLSIIGFICSALFLSQAYSLVLYTIIALSTLPMLQPGSNKRVYRALSAKEILTVLVILVGSIVGFKLIAIIFT